MAIPLTNGAHGGLFDRLGLLGGMLADINSHRGGTATSGVLAQASIITRVANMETYWAATIDNRSTIDGIYTSMSAFQAAQGTFCSQLSTVAQNTVKDMANQDVTLAAKTLPNALALLISQMKTSGDSILGSTVAAGAQTSVGSPVGTPAICASVKDTAGLNLQNVFAETLTFTCTSGSQDGAVSGQEPFQLTAPTAVSDQLSHLWPGGSGTIGQITQVDASLNNSGGNALQNSDYETFTNANIPDNWVLAVGVIGVDVLAGGSGYTGANSLKYLGDGATLSEVRQKFNTTPSTVLGTGGTPFQLKPLTVYAISFWVKMDVTPAAGVIAISLHDGSTVINDAAGTANTVSKSLTAVSTTWVNTTGFFRTPAVLPANQYITVHLTTAISTGKSVFIDRLALTPASQIYPGGPYIAAFSGATKTIKGDQFTIAITNSRGAFAALFERFFGMRQLGLTIPYVSGGNTIPENLITA